MPLGRHFDIVLRVFRALKRQEQVNTTTIVQRHELKPRTAQRLIERMRDMLGIPVEYDPRRRSLYLSEPTCELPAAFLRRSEGIALSVAARLGLSFALPAALGLEGGASKIEGLLLDEAGLDVGPLLERLRFSPTASRPVDPGVFDRLLAACANRRTVQMTYWTASRNVLTRRMVDPYLVELRGSDWYLVGWCHTRREVRVFAASRIVELSLDERTFEQPPDFDPATYFQGAFGATRGRTVSEVVLEFDETAGRWARERSWHESQRAEETPNGRVRMRLDVADTPELRRWILSWGGGVRVLAPEGLAQAIRDEHRRAARG